MEVYFIKISFPTTASVSNPTNITFKNRKYIVHNDLLRTLDHKKDAEFLRVTLYRKSAFLIISILLTFGFDHDDIKYSQFRGRKLLRFYDFKITLFFYNILNEMVRSVPSSGVYASCNTWCKLCII